jgi:protein-disulfide isomerase
MSKFSSLSMIGLMVALSSNVLALGGCQRQDEQTQKKLDLLLSKMEGLEKKVASGAMNRPAGQMPGQAAQQPRRGPDPAAVYGVDITGDPFVGPADAKVTIVKASDYACPFCQRSEPTLEQLLKDYSGKVRVVYKDYIVHPATATVPAYAACAANEQGKFAEFNKALWEKAFGKDTSETMMTSIATDLKLNLDKFKADSASDKCKKAVADDQRILSAVGVSGTPAFFINGRYLSGARPIEQFKVLVDEELKKADDAIGKNGVTASNYYDKVVFGPGKKAL